MALKLIKRRENRPERTIPIDWTIVFYIFQKTVDKTEDTLLTKNIQNAKYFEFLPKWLVVSVALLTAEYL